MSDLSTHDGPGPESQTIAVVQRLRDGDEDAAQELFDKYVSRLVLLARSRLSPKFNSRIDPEDVVNSAYRSFFIRSRQGEFEFQEGKDLWRLLATITIHKLHRQVDRQMAAKRSVDREHAKHEGQPSLELLSREPSAEEALIVADQIRILKDGLTENQQDMLEYRLQGFTLEEIAKKVNRCERTVRRFFERLKSKLEEGVCPE